MGGVQWICAVLSLESETIKTIVHGDKETYKNMDCGTSFICTIDGFSTIGLLKALETYLSIAYKFRRSTEWMMARRIFQILLRISFLIFFEKNVLIF